MVWSQLEIEPAHVAYACVGIFSTIFSLVSLFVKEKLYIGEATVATIAGLILGPHCLDWFNPFTWGNWEHITLEISRILLCIQIVAVAVELPKKYMKKHWLSVAILLLPVMTFGWLIVGLFIWALIPHFSFPSALLVSACVTATDPVLAAAVVGKGKFAERVPGHLRNLLSAESGCNDGMAFPFIYLSLNLLLYKGHAGEIVKDWILLTILYECIFGCLLGISIGFVMKRAVAFAETKKLIDRESFLAIFVFIAFNSAGIGSMLGVDDLLVSFAAGTTFGWNGEFARKTEESHVSTVIDLLLNLAFFVYFGAIIPWPDFNNVALGLNVWRLVVLAIVIIFLRRMPAVMAFYKFIPDIKSWREALFCGHFGPIGVGAIFAVILAKKELEAHYTAEETPLIELPGPDFPHYQLLETLWPIVCFIILTSIIVHGSSVAVLTLGKRLNRMAITMTFSTTNTRDQGPTWLSRLQKLEKASTSFSLHRIDTNSDDFKEKGSETPPKHDFDVPTINVSNAEANSGDLGLGPRAPTIETSGIKVRPAGGAKRRNKKKKRRPTPGDILKKSLSRNDDFRTDTGLNDEESRPRPQTEFLQLGRSTTKQATDETDEGTIRETVQPNGKESSGDSELSSGSTEVPKAQHKTSGDMEVDHEDDGVILGDPNEGIKGSGVPTTVYKEGDLLIIEDHDGEIYETVSLSARKEDKSPSQEADNLSVHSEESLRRQMTNYSAVSIDSAHSSTLSPTASLRKLKKHTSKALYRKDDPKHRKVYAHQIDDMIVIENEEGEIIRRYRVNRRGSQSGEVLRTTHSGDKQPRARSSSIVGKALSWMGRNKEEEDLSNTTSIEKVAPSTSVQSGASGLSKDNTKLELKITNILKGHDRSGGAHYLEPVGKPIRARRPSVVPEASGTSEDSELSQDSEEYDNSDSSGDEEVIETAVEKKRRLAALGKLPGQKRRDDDEEE